MSNQPQAIFPFPVRKADPTSTPLSVASSESGEISVKNVSPPLISPISHFSHEPKTPQLSDLALYGPIGNIVQRIEPLTEAHPAPILLELLIGMGSMMGNKPFFIAQSTKHHTNLFGVVTGQSSTGRKGSAWGVSKSVLGQIDQSWVQENITNGIGSGEGIIFKLKDLDDPEQERLRDKRLLLREGEFSRVFQVMKRGGSTVSDAIINGWDSNPLGTLTKKPMVASNSHISMVCDVTREELLRLGTTAQSNGFANRFLWCYSAMTKLLPRAKAIPPDLIKREVDQIKGSLKKNLLSQSREMTRTQAADEYWDEIYEELTIRPNSVWGSVTHRAAAQVVRLSMIYALVDGSDEIDFKHLIAAKALCDYCDQSARWAFEGRAYGEHAQKILDNLQYGELTQTDLHTLFQRHMSKPMINQTLKEISHLIEVVTERTNGRNKTSYMLKK